MGLWAVRLGGQVIWTQGGEEIWYKSEREAEQALIDEIKDCERAFKAGYMEDEGDFDDYRIVEV
jgi:hypothetical protein